MRRAPPDFATLAIVYREPEAATLVSMLRGHGIAAFVPTWSVVTMYWHYTVLVDGIAVLVPSREFEAAVALVGDPRDLPAPPRAFRGGRLRNILIALIFGLLPIFVYGTFGLLLPPRARGSYARLAPQTADA